MHRDGINSLSYEVVKIDKFDLFTKITVGVGKPWRGPGRVQGPQTNTVKTSDTWIFQFWSGGSDMLDSAVSLILLVFAQMDGGLCLLCRPLRTPLWLDTGCNQSAAFIWRSDAAAATHPGRVFLFWKSIRSNNRGFLGKSKGCVCGSEWPGFWFWFFGWGSVDVVLIKIKWEK